MECLDFSKYFIPCLIRGLFINSRLTVLTRSCWNSFRVFFQIATESCNSVRSSWEPVTNGIPQGLVLGLMTLRTLFPELYRSINQPLSYILLQHGVNALIHWTLDWLLNTPSIPKCFAMTVENIITAAPNYTLDDKPLASSSCVKDLCVYGLMRS